MSLQRSIVASLAILGLVGLGAAAPAHAQGDPEAPPLVVGTNKAYCHAAEDGMTAWMNTLADDGPGTTYNVFGEPAFVDPVQGIGFDPVQDEDFTIRIPLSPPSDGVVLAGAANVQVFFGSGAYGGGQGSVATSLALDGTDLATGEAQDHTMQPHNSNAPGGAGPYEELTWTLDVPATTVPAGALLEWVISGHIDYGNNIFLSCFETRGRSSIELPVSSVAGPVGQTSNSTTNTTSDSDSNMTSSSTTSGSKSTTSKATSGSATTAGNQTGNGTADDAKDSPAPPIAFVGLAVVLAAIAVRRRLR
jgi:MYXO-CTERM domain-containing protein